MHTNALGGANAWRHSASVLHFAPQANRIHNTGTTCTSTHKACTKHNVPHSTTCITELTHKHERQHTACVQTHTHILSFTLILIALQPPCSWLPGVRGLLPPTPGCMAPHGPYRHPQSTKIPRKWEGVFNAPSPLEREHKPTDHPPGATHNRSRPRRRESGTADGGRGTAGPRTAVGGRRTDKYRPTVGTT
jgi:hypothetical protein